jgi:hypothetical protein
MHLKLNKFKKAKNGKIRKLTTSADVGNGETEGF